MRSIKKIVGVTLFLFLYSAILLASAARIEINVGFTDEENRKRIPKEITLHNGLEIVISGYREVSNLHVELNHSKVDGIEINGKVVIKLFNARQKEEVAPGKGEYHASLPFWLSVDYFGKDSPLESIELGKVSPFYDAIQLSKAAEDFIKKEILSKYFKEEEIFAMDSQELNERINQIRELKEIPIDQIRVREEKIPGGKKIGVASPTIVIEAIAAFMAKRFKEELNIAFFSKFKKTLIKVEELQKLFPRTSGFLLDSEPYNYRWFLPTLRGLFQEDMNNIAVGIMDCLKWEKDKNEIDREHEDGYYAAMVSLSLIDSIKNRMHPADAIEKLNESNFLSEEKTSVFVNSVKLLTLISRNLRDTTSDGWIKPAELKILVSKPGGEIGRLFLGLIYNREKTKFKEIKFNDKTLEVLIIGDKIKEFFRIAYRISQQAKIVQEHLQDIKEKKEQGKKIGFTDYHAYLGTAVDIIELSFDFVEFAGIVKDEKKGKFNTYIFIMKAALEISKNIHEKSYAAALVNLLDILQKIMPGSIEKGKPASPVIGAIIKYGTFMVAMINAKTSDEMASVLEDAALPVGGYRFKRTRPFSISLNSYAGIFVSCERLADISADDPMTGIDVNMEPVDRNDVNIAFTAPVGFGVNFGSEKYRVSHSFFFPVIDIGAVVSFRLGSHKGLPELTWENVLAPGFFYILGLKNNPISIGIGIQYGPQLRKFAVTEESGAEAVLRAKAFRVGASLVVDIPIFHFF